MDNLLLYLLKLQYRNKEREKEPKKKKMTCLSSIYIIANYFSTALFGRLVGKNRMIRRECSFHSISSTSGRNNDSFNEIKYFYFKKRQMQCKGFNSKIIYFFPFLSFFL